MIRVGVLEDDQDMRAYLATLLRQAPDMEVQFACATVAEAAAEMQKCKPDLCLVDIKLPDGNGIDFIRTFPADGSICSLVLTVLGDKASVLLAFEVGANGYLLKDTPAEQILRDIRAVAEGGNPISPQAASHVLSLLQKKPVNATTDLDGITLTTREIEVLTFFSRGLSYAETAEALEMSPHTVSSHVKTIYSKMGVHSRNEAIFEAVQNGWLTL